LARANIIPTEERAQQLWHNLPALMFMDFWQAQNHQKDLRELARLLGVLWLREDAEQDEKTSVRKITALPNELRIPLACAIEPGIVDVVKKYFGKKGGINPPDWAGKSEVVEMFSTSKEEFLQFVRGFIAPKVT
jgi:hypothetical protein